MTIGWRFLGVPVLALVVSATQAQPRIELAPPAVLECLQVAAGKPPEPEYPFEPYKANQPGRVKASVTLPGGLFGNEVEILSSEGDSAFVDASRRFLRSLSAPCLKEGEKVRLHYEFVFQRDQKVVWSPPQEIGDAARREMAKCARHREGSRSPEYPARALQNNVQGRVLALMTFKSPDSPPEVELVHRPSALAFASTLRRWTAEMRMPCHSGEPVRVGALFIFQLDGGAYGFKAATLTELLSLSKGIRERRLELDTTAMGCPFNLRLTYYQPSRRNSVGEVGDSDPRRRPLLELLAGLELDTRQDILDTVFADTADVAVPCLRLNLNDPKEKTS